ncbi:cytochrome o ubiquinol oxidase subunit IV [Bordetella sp. 2513F-2]
MSHDSAVDHDHASHGSMKSYVIGFILSIILTLAAFWLVMSDAAPRHLALPGIVVLCVAQLLVQLVFFLHMGLSKSARENTTAFVFTLMVIAILVGGSVWVLHNMNANMMHPMPAAVAQ